MLGFNEAINSSFESSDATELSWYVPYFSATTTRDTSVARPGSPAGTVASMRVDAAPTTAQSGLMCVNTYRLHAPGETCVISMYIKGTAGKQVIIADRILDRFRNYITEGIGARTWTLTGGWDRIWTNPFTWVADYFIPGFDVITSDLLAHTFWVDDVQVEENLVSLYLPAPQERWAGQVLANLGLTGAAYEWNGMVFTGVGTNGDFIVNKVSALLGHPELRTTDVERQDGWGDFGGLQMPKSRHVAMDVQVRADTSVIMETYIRNMKRVFRITDGSPGPPLPLVLQRYPGNEQRFLMAKLEKYDGDSTYDVARRLYTASIMWKCDDPRIYSNVLASRVGAILGGSSTADFGVHNAGNVDAFPQVILNCISGTCPSPEVQNVTDRNRFIKCNMTISAGQSITIDARTRTAKLNDGTDVPLTTDSLWWMIKPGYNEILISRVGTTGETDFTLNYRDTSV